MICAGCEIWEEYQTLEARYEALEAELKQMREEKTRLEVENGKLKRQQAFYQNISAPLPRKKRRAFRRPNSGKRFPGKPKGSLGGTRPTPKPDIVIAPEWDNCRNCGAPLPPPEVVDHRIIEDIVKNRRSKTGGMKCSTSGCCHSATGYHQSKTGGILS